MQPSAAANEAAKPKSNASLLALFLLGAVTLLYLFAGEEGGSGTDGKLQLFKTMFLSLLIEALPFILIGVVVSALLQVFVPDRIIRRAIPKNPLLAVLAASLLGIIVPICECGMVPAIRRLIRKGMPLHAATAFILAGPILNPIVLWSTLAAFRSHPEIAWIRMGLAFAVAIAAGLAVHRFVSGQALRGEDAVAASPTGAAAGVKPADKNRGRASRQPAASLSQAASPPSASLPMAAGLHSASQSEAAAPPSPFRVLTPVPGRNRGFEAAGHAVSEFFDMGRYIVFGSFLVALLMTFVAQSDLASLGGGSAAGSVSMMALGFLLSLCSTSDAFIAQSFSASFTGGSLIAFMVFGPMMNLKVMLMMLAVFRTRFVLGLCAFAAVLVFAAALVLDMTLLH
ncbi:MULTISPECIES: permease [unclassified Paenibacillus]|uniref:permease n=1 Tax=unclassified Paenibacillus TaxID=185978 RepID=UPI0009555398|nr:MULTISPECIES: permease [unclassified Paenibacillus]ASS68564.1 permease [Paenibacillus sp. RUD330]SIR63520.1 hypothetical protein SAMN05880555_4520 [Paenibacillus sp. RU4X]SIR71843.1 hypothetical protein SAMN05880570_4522 [Paenibacillus sp. RU4T]